MPDPLWLQNLGYTAAEDRALLEGLFPGEGTVVGCAVTQRAAGANWSVDVAGGTVVVRGDDVASQGHYVVPVSAVNVPLTVGAPATGQRKELVYVKVRDSAHQAGVSQNDYTIGVAVSTGNPAAEPTLPLTAIPLAVITTTPSSVSVQTAAISDRRSGARVAGADYRSATQTDYPAGGTPVVGDKRVILSGSMIPEVEVYAPSSQNADNSGWGKQAGVPRFIWFSQTPPLTALEQGQSFSSTVMEITTKQVMWFDLSGIAQVAFAEQAAGQTSLWEMQVLLQYAFNSTTYSNLAEVEDTASNGAFVGPVTFKKALPINWGFAAGPGTHRWRLNVGLTLRAPTSLRLFPARLTLKCVPSYTWPVL